MTNAHDFEFTALDGAPLPLRTFSGKAVLVVNTASKCGLTPQYEGLEDLYTQYKDKGLVVLGVPCNQFAGQEPERRRKSPPSAKPGSTSTFRSLSRPTSRTPAGTLSTPGRKARWVRRPCRYGTSTRS